MSTNEVAETQRSLDVGVQNQINQMMNQENGLKLPANYAVGNALKSAFFALKGNKDGDLIQVASHMPEMKTSIANALMDMVVQGLTPAKTQVYFIRYGNQIKMQRSYFGTQAALKRLSEVHDCWANVVHEGDGLEIGAENDRLVVKDWKPTLEGLDKAIKYVYAVIEMTDGTHQHTIMTFKQIKNSWSQTRSKGAVQNKFSDEMAKRTVLNRAAKNILNTSDDSDLVVGAINNTTSNEYDDDQSAKDVTPKKTVADLIEDKPAKDSQEQSETPQQSESVSEASEIASESVSESEASASSEPLTSESDGKEVYDDASGTQQTDLFPNGDGVRSKFD